MTRSLSAQVFVAGWRTFRRLMVSYEKHSLRAEWVEMLQIKSYSDDVEVDPIRDKLLNLPTSAGKQ